MAGSNRRFALVVALPFLSLAMSGMARAATYTVTNTLDSGTGSIRGGDSREYCGRHEHH
jgi:hypothetical protein